MGEDIPEMTPAPDSVTPAAEDEDIGGARPDLRDPDLDDLGSEDDDVDLEAFMAQIVEEARAGRGKVYLPGEPVRGKDGRWVKGTPSPHPRGRPKNPPRTFNMRQTVLDGLELLDQPVTLKKRKGDKRTVRMPAIKAIMQNVVRRAAVEDDWRAIVLCLQLRERYAAYRDSELNRMMDAVLRTKSNYSLPGEKMPDDVREIYDELWRRIGEAPRKAG